MLEKFECHLCWSVPSIVGLPDGRLLILGVVPDPQQAPQFNILEITCTVEGKKYNIYILQHNKYLQKNGGGYVYAACVIKDTVYSLT